MNGVRAKTVLSYVLLPQVVPRARKLFASGFGYIAFLMARIYGAVRLLPDTHPYLSSANIGKYGLRHVIAEAANHLVLKKENLDQIVIFFTLLIGVVILVAQFVLLAYGIIMKPAFAGSIFQTPDPVNSGGVTDMAFIVLDRIFGVPNLFTTASGMSTNVMPGGNPWPFHVGLHEMLRFYSLGLLLVGVIIFLYYVLIVVGETATTGHPFGQRFQNVWVPIRLVVALGLLLPINYGLNSAQYIVLYTAKFGSGFATNGWLTFNSTIRDSGTMDAAKANPLGEAESLLAKPVEPNGMAIAQMMNIVHACAYAYWKTETKVNLPPPAYGNNFYIKPYLVKLPRQGATNTAQRLDVTAGTSYTDALAFYNNGDIVIRFGRQDDAYENETGQVKPLCGDVRIAIGYLETIGQGATVGGPDQMQEFYFNLIKDAWFTTDTLVRKVAWRHVELGLNIKPHYQCEPWMGDAAITGRCQDEVPPAGARQAVANYFTNRIKQEVPIAWNRAAVNYAGIGITTEVLDRGWAGAGIWYNTIAGINGAFIDSVTRQPSFVIYPKAMELVRKERFKHDTSPEPLKQFDPNISENDQLVIPDADNAQTVARVLNSVFVWWNKDDGDATKGDKTITGSSFENAINTVFGVHGLFALRGANAHVHPLAQLAALGKSLVDSAIFNMGTSVVTGGLGGIFKAMQNATGEKVASAISSITSTISYLGLTAGFILYYVLPFMPFLYFFFAFGTWIKSIFEAMVGAPLWALAHLRLDGEGLPGDSASNGYFLILEIFLRPFLTVFGLVAATIILTAQVRMLNILWTIVTSNLTGFEGYEASGPGSQQKIAVLGYKLLPKNTIDQFFFTLVYAIIVYMMATASFKLIDKIPDQMLRFLGAGVSAFSDINPDATEGLSRYAALGGFQVTQQLSQGMTGLSRGVGGAVGEELKGITTALKGGK